MTTSAQDRATTKQPPAPIRFGTRVVLLAGFGGLLVLMATAGADSLRVLRQIHASNAQIHRDFLSREHRLDQLRDTLYLSGTVVRDYILLDPGHSAAETLRGELQTYHDDMKAALEAYSRSLRPDERDSFQRLTDELENYWSVLDPVFQWDAKEKRERGYWFLRQELFPRRTTVLSAARNIAAVNEQTLKEGEKLVAQVFARFEHRLEIMTTIGLGLGLLVAFISISYILRLEKNADLRYQESLRAQDELKKLSARLVDAQEQERRAISRELHDEVSQLLTALLMDLGKLAARLGADGQFREPLEKLKKLATNSVSAIRNVSLLLRPPMLDDLGLVPALEWQARDVSKRTGMLVDLVQENVSDSLPEDYKTCVYRVVQEALHNCSRHAEARNVRVIVRQEPERLLLTVQDDGRGFDVQHTHGLGLVGMTERAARLDGVFKVESEPGRGTLLRIELPLVRQALQETVAP